MGCRAHILEAFILWVSLTSAGLVASTVYDLKTFVIGANGTTVTEKHPEYDNDAQFEEFFFGYSMGIALFLTVIALVAWHCCCRLNDCGSVSTFLRLLPSIQLVVLVATIAVIHATAAMRFKRGDERIVGWVLFGCECLCLLLELCVRPPSRPLITVVSTTAELMVSAMVAAQLVTVSQLSFLYAAFGLSCVYAVYITWYAHEPEALEQYSALVGFALGFGLAIGSQGLHDFKSWSEISGYAILFAFNFILPMLERKYEKLDVDGASDRTDRTTAFLHNSV